MHLFPMRQPRENFCHASVKQIKAAVDYLPTELFQDFHRLLLPNLFQAFQSPRKYKKALIAAKQGLNRGSELSTLKHLLQAGYLVHYHLQGTCNIQHLHGHFAHSPTSVTLFASVMSNIPFSFTGHAKDIYTSKPEKLRRKIEMAKFVVTCTAHNKKFLEDLAGSTTTPIHCVYHGIDLSLFQNSFTNTPISSPYRLLTVARITEKKGLPTIYNALSLLKKRGMNFRHTLIGDGDDRKKIEKLITELGLKSDCTLLGTRTHEEVLEKFKESDAFLLGCEIAQNGDRDGIPNVLVESLAMGVPAISTTVSAIPEVLLHEETGLTVSPKEPDDFANAIEKVLHNQDLRNKLRQKGQDFVQENFDNSKWIKKLSDIFTQHVNG